jgi:hypothetical protein
MKSEISFFFIIVHTFDNYIKREITFSAVSLSIFLFLFFFL